MIAGYWGRLRPTVKAAPPYTMDRFREPSEDAAVGRLAPTSEGRGGRGRARPPRARLHAFLWQDGSDDRTWARSAGPSAGPSAMNNRGQIVGESDIGLWPRVTPFSGRTGQVIGSGNAGRQDSGELGLQHQRTRGDRSEPPTAGRSGGRFCGTRARWSTSAPWAEPLVMPLDINNRGDVVGVSGDEGNRFHAFFWRAGTMADLGVPLGGLR